MNWIYLSTDAEEAKTIVEETITQSHLREAFEYHDVEIGRGAQIAARVGFNPMSTVVFNGQVDKKTLANLLDRFVDRRYFVSYESDFSEVQRLQVPAPKECLKLRRIHHGEHNFDYRLA